LATTKRLSTPWVLAWTGPMMRSMLDQLAAPSWNS